jgi:hypothetical protein
VEAFIRGDELAIKPKPKAPTARARKAAAQKVD